MPPTERLEAVKRIIDEAMPHNAIGAVGLGRIWTLLNAPNPRVFEGNSDS